MTSQGYSWEDLLWALNSIQDAEYAIAAMYGLQVYEWFSCIEEEIKLIWKARWTSVKLSYLLCRYYPLTCWPIIMWAYLGNHSFDECVRIGRPVHILLAPFQFFAQGVMLMRAYAFTGRDWRVLVALGICYCALLGIDIWAFCSHVNMPPPLFYTSMGPTGCFPNYGSGVMAIRIGLTMLAATLMDLVSLVAILVYCKRESSLTGGSLASYFIKQGLGAFILIAVVNIAAAIAFFKPPSYHGGIGLPLSLAVSSLVACQVILQLRRKVTLTPTEISRQNSMVVNIALENIMRCSAHDTRDLWLMDTEESARRTLTRFQSPQN